MSSQLAWLGLHLEAMQEQFPYLLFPYYMAQTAPLEGNTIPDPDLDFSEGPHLRNAIQ